MLQKALLIKFMMMHLGNELSFNLVDEDLMEAVIVIQDDLGNFVIMQLETSA